MMKKIFILLGIIAAGVAGLVMILGVLLTPDNLGSCGQRPDNSEGCQAAAAIIAVSGGDTIARAKSAVELYENGWANEIIFSGAAADPNSRSNAAAMRDFAVNAGVPSGEIIVEEASKNTRENAINSAEILKKNKIKTAILTTSPYHVRRTLLEFQRAAPDVTFRAHPADDPTWHFWFLRPSGWWRVAKELGGLIVFGLRGVF